jgi:hypothetical protein
MLGLKLLFWLVVTTVLAAGCAGSSVTRDLQTTYIGTPVAAFFMERGGPVSSVGFGKGGRVYLWFSGRDSAYQPGDTGTVDLIGNTEWWTGYRVPNYNPLLECRVDIFTGADGYILDIRMHGGERDWRARQRCREVFGAGWLG